MYTYFKYLNVSWKQLLLLWAIKHIANFVLQSAPHNYRLLLLRVVWDTEDDTGPSQHHSAQGQPVAAKQACIDGWPVCLSCCDSLTDRGRSTDPSEALRPGSAGESPTCLILSGDTGH